VSDSNLATHAYQLLRDRLINGQLLPGVVVSEKQLADELGISRTPIGDAVRQLSYEGFVEQVPRYGTLVKEITRHDLIEVYELREAIEPYAARKAASHITSGQLEQLEVLCRAIEGLAPKLDGSTGTALDGEDLRQFLAADMAFHLLIVRAAGNSRILTVIQTSQAVSKVFRVRRQKHDLDLLHRASHCHRQILAALQSGNGDGAAEQMLQHIIQSKQETLNYIDKQQGRRPLPEATYSLELDAETRRQLDLLKGK
jgi:DNA-binding GntR family transcriptional regulator